MLTGLLNLKKPELTMSPNKTCGTAALALCHSGVTSRPKTPLCTDSSEASSNSLDVQCRSTPPHFQLQGIAMRLNCPLNRFATCAGARRSPHSYSGGGSLRPSLLGVCAKFNCKCLPPDFFNEARGNAITASTHFMHELRSKDTPRGSTSSCRPQSASAALAIDGTISLPSLCCAKCTSSSSSARAP